MDFSSHEPNILIGINDCGKTTILKAIGLLLDEKPSYFSVKDNSSKKDFSNSPLPPEAFDTLLKKHNLPKIDYSQNQTFVFGKFIIEENDISNEPISPFSNLVLWTIEKSPEYLWLMKSYESNASTVSSYILSQDWLEQDGLPLQLTGKTAADLNRKTKELGISNEEIENVNKLGRFSNLEKIRAIYSKLDLQAMWAEYKPSNADRSLFPIFRYLDWNCSLDDIKKTAADAMATMVEAHIAPIKADANRAALKVESEINEHLKTLKDSIGDMIPNITGIKTKIYFDVKESITDILINKLNGDGDIHLDLQGEGVKRQIWFALIKSGALASIESGMTNTKFIWAFDEPETHLYPAAQRQFFDIIKEVSKTNVQTLISTHSTIFIDKSKLQTIRSVSIDDSAYTTFDICDSIDEVFEALELRNSDFLFYDKFLVIEGDTEAYLIPALYKLHTSRTLAEDNIQLINLTGKSKWVEGKKALENVLNGFKKSLDYVVYLFDADAQFDLGKKEITDKFFFAGKQDIEDSISNEVWINFVRENTEEQVVLSDSEIEKIKGDIPHDQKMPSKGKFFVQLEKLAREKLGKILGTEVNWSVLNAKGSDSALLLIKHIDSMDKVSPQIKLAFDKLIDKKHEIVTEVAEEAVQAVINL